VTVVILIPARFQSSRYPGKPLVPLRGKDGSKTLIQRTWETGKAVSGVDRVLVATDDDRIAEAVQGFGGEVVMTSDRCANGTERCADALERLGAKPEIVVNLQGDALLTPQWFIEDLVDALRARPEMGVATPILRCDADTYAHFREDRAAGRVGGTTAVFTRDMAALYFSKEVIPYLPDACASDPSVYHHVGVYAYRPTALRRYIGWTAGPLELNEGLEQLRFLEHGEPVLCVEVEARGRVFWELNNPVDVARIESVL
jgi:3-deoxy-manno-octulosonate cytidylyltransferase (CMP-KDO synthetase)